MLYLDSCYLNENSNLDIVVNNGKVVGFTIKCDKSSELIKIDDSIILLEELPSNNSYLTEFIGISYLKYVNAFYFCNLSVDFLKKQSVLGITCSSFCNKKFRFNNLIKPIRVAPYIYVINKECDYTSIYKKNGFILFDSRRGYTCSIGKEIINKFNDSSIRVSDINIIVLNDDFFELEITFSDCRSPMELGKFIFLSKVISNETNITYQVQNSFIVEKEDRKTYCLNDRLQSDCYLPKFKFLKYFSSNEVVFKFMGEVDKYHREYKKRQLIP